MGNTEQPTSTTDVPAVADTNGWVWGKAIDGNLSDLGLFVNFDNEIRLPDNSTVVSGIRVVLNNSFASLPVCGHSYATAQFIGRGATEFSLQLTGVGNYALSRIQAMHEELEKNARLFRKFKGAAAVDVKDNPLLQLCGVEDGVISSVDAKTEEGFTDLYRMTLAFTSEGHHMESLSQEAFVSSENYTEMLEAMLGRIRVTQVSFEQALRNAQPWYGSEVFVRSVAGILGGFVFGLPMALIANAAITSSREQGAVTTDVSSLINGAENIGSSIYSALEHALDPQRERERTERQIGTDAPIITPTSDENSNGARFEVDLNGAPDWLHEHLQNLRDALNRLMPKLPGLDFFVGPNRGRYFDITQVDLETGAGIRTSTIRAFPAVFGRESSLICGIMRGLRRQWPKGSPDEAAEIMMELNNAQSELLGIARQALDDGRGEGDFESVFPGVLSRVLGSRRANTHPTYLDLDLPAHPATSNVMDTEPDFYWFNDSEEGMLNEIGPEIIAESDYRLINAMATMALLSTGETWADTYLGRSRVGPADLSKWGTLGDEQQTPIMDGGPQSSLSIDHATQAPDADSAFIETISGHPIGGGLAMGDSTMVDRAIAISGSAVSNTREQGVQFRRNQMIRGSNMSIPSANATEPIGLGPVDTAINSSDRSNSFGREFIRSTVEQSLLQNPDQTLTMRRAFPSFRIYFLEDDIGQDREHLLPPGSTGSRLVMYMDDFYNYNSVREIRLVRSRKSPADLLVLTLTNVAGLLEERSWVHPTEYPTELYEAGLEETELENPLKKLILKEGLKVQARLGYCVDEETEILTKRGWLKQDQLEVGDIALTLNHETGLSEWGPVQAINRFEVVDHPMVALDGACHSSLTTMGHKWPVLRTTTVGGKKCTIRDWTFSEKLNTSHQLVCAAEHSYEGEKVWDDAFVEVVAWFWTEGHITNSSTPGRRPGLVISQSATANPDNVVRIRLALESLFGPAQEKIGNGRYVSSDVSPRWREKRRPGRGEVEFRLNCAAASQILEVAPKKIVSRDFILQLTPEQLELFIRVSNEADGSYSQGDDGPLLISQKDPEALEALELAASLAGYRTRRYFAQHTTEGGDGIRYHPNLLYLSRVRTAHIDKRYLFPRVVRYTGITWCPTTTNHSWMARRHGITHFTGNSNDPNKMGNKFIGEIVEISYNAECSDEVTVICQSYGSELVLEPKGANPDQRVEFLDTPDMVHTLMLSPELAHFGRYSVNPNYNPAEARTRATSNTRNNVPVDGSAADYLRFGITGLVRPGETFDELREQLLFLRSRYICANKAADDNIYAPSMRELSSTWDRFRADSSQLLGWLGGLFQFGHDVADAIPVYRWLVWIPNRIMQGIADGLMWLKDLVNPLNMNISGQTIWEILKECELRHPGWIAHPRPYGTRMTLFFGVPTFRYWADEISEQEIQVLSRLRSQLEGIQDEAELVERAIAYRRGLNAMEAEMGSMPEASRNPQFNRGTLADEFWYRTFRDMRINRWLGGAGEYVGRVMGRFRPFRRYHLITSDHHIILNNLRASDKGVFNAVNLQYSGGFYTMKADDDIPDECTKVGTFDYSHSVNSEVIARRYCIGLLQQSLKDIYKGEIVVTGMDIDPYDTVYLHDERADMYGAFDVEQVVDTFTAETGWITEITPDLITGTNEWSTMSTRVARGAALGAISQRYLGSRLNAWSLLAASTIGSPVAAVGAAGLTRQAGGGLISQGLAASAMTPIGALIAWTGGYYIVRWTQDRQPVWVSPLIIGNRPFMSGLDGFRQDGLFASLRGRWVAECNAAEQGWRRLHLGAIFSDLSIGASQRLSGQLI